MALHGPPLKINCYLCIRFSCANRNPWRGALQHKSRLYGPHHHHFKTLSVELVLSSQVQCCSFQSGLHARICTAESTARLTISSLAVQRRHAEHNGEPKSMHPIMPPFNLIQLTASAQTIS
jgi:hypothetical protein